MPSKSSCLTDFLGIRYQAAQKKSINFLVGYTSRKERAIPAGSFIPRLSYTRLDDYVNNTVKTVGRHDARRFVLPPDVHLREVFYDSPQADGVSSYDDGRGRVPRQLHRDEPSKVRLGCIA